MIYCNQYDDKSRVEGTRFQLAEEFMDIVKALKEINFDKEEILTMVEISYMSEKEIHERSERAKKKIAQDLEKILNILNKEHNETSDNHDDDTFNEMFKDLF